MIKNWDYSQFFQKKKTKKLDFVMVRFILVQLGTGFSKRNVMSGEKKRTEYDVIAKSKYFDKRWYLNKYTDVARRGVDPVSHYLNNGWKEGRNPGPNFDTNGYLKRYPECEQNPLIHFEKIGRKKKYLTTPYFDEKVSSTYWLNHDKLNGTKKVMYSCISGNYDDIITDFYPNPEYDYVLFTDNKKLLKQKRYLWWNIRPLVFNKLDSVRNARWHKTHPHVLFPEYEYSIWVDSNVQISGEEIYKLINKHINLRHKIAISLHPIRDCIYDEAEACITDGKDDPAVINKQMDLLKSDGYPAHNGLYETNLLLRRHMDKDIINLCEAWWDFIENYSRRDQLSFNYVLWKSGIKHSPIDDVSLRFNPQFKLIVHNYKPRAANYITNKILVHMHLIYSDQIDWFLSKLKNITCAYDLVVTVAATDEQAVEKLRSFKQDVKVVTIPNCYNDIYAFWCILQKLVLSDYDAVLKLYTPEKLNQKVAKNGIDYSGFELRDSLVLSLIESKHRFKKCLNLIQMSDVGAIVLKNAINSRVDDVVDTKELCSRIGINYTDTAVILDSMFMIKPYVLKSFINSSFDNFVDGDFMERVGVQPVLNMFCIIMVNKGLRVYGERLSFSRLRGLSSGRTKQRKETLDDYHCIANSKFFDRKWYLKKYKDVANKGVDPVKHYLELGWKEGRNPGPDFDTNKYLDYNIDVKNAKINPLLHYERNGKFEADRIVETNVCNSLVYKFYSFAHKFIRKDKVKNILLVSNELTHTGASISLLKAAQIFNEMGYKVTTVSIVGGSLIDDFKKEGSVTITKKLENVLKIASRCDFAIVNTLWPYDIYNMLKDFLPTVWWIREPSSILSKNEFIKKALISAKNVYAMSPFSRNEFLKFNAGIKVIKHGMDDFGETQISLPRKTTFAVIGTICDRKGQDVFVTAINKIPVSIRNKAEFLIVGKKSPKYNAFDELNIPECVKVIPAISNINDMMKFYSNISCVVVPSREEPTSRFAIESMMMGRPVIMSDHVGAQYLVNKHNGFIFRNEDSDQLAEILESMIKSPSKLKNMGKAARKAYLENNSIPVYRKNLMNMLNDTTKKFYKRKILVHIHLFYHNQLNWFLSRLKNITCDYDLWVTVTENNKATTQKIKKFKKDAHILKVPNRGYDIYPFWLVLQKISLSDYDAVLKLHTKNRRKTKWGKNGISYTKFEWRDDLINPLVGSKSLFKKALKTLSANDVGMVGSANLIGNKENVEQAKNTKNFCEEFGITYSKDCPFVCGTMFLMKSSLLYGFQKYSFKDSDFSSTSVTGSTGTLAHSLETVFGLIVADKNMKLAGVQSFITSYKAEILKLKQAYLNFINFIKRQKEDIDYIRHSKFFDKKWYLKTYPDVAEEHADPALHYLMYGWKEGRQPGPRFNPKFYLDNNLDVKRAKVNPLLHYEKHGKHEGRVVSKKRSKSPLSVKEYYDAVKSKSAEAIAIDKPVIISLTTFPGRISIVHETIRSLKNQSFKPDKIVLYLSEKEFPKKMREIPNTLKELQDEIFEIHWIKKTLFSFQKLIPTLKEYPDAVIVTADDDILYSRNWLKLLVRAYQENPTNIHCHRAHRITFKRGQVRSYNDWEMGKRDESIAYNNFLTGVGGVLYPPHCLDEEIINDRLFLKLCPKADDIWIWAMALRHHTKIHVLKENITALELTPGSQEGACLCKINTGEECYNDVQLRNVFKKYPEVLTLIKSERKTNRLLAYLLYPYYLFEFFRCKGNKVR